jgi:hypothetical protein
LNCGVGAYCTINNEQNLFLWYIYSSTEVLMSTFNSVAVVVKQSASVFIPVAAEVKEQIALAFERAARSGMSDKLYRYSLTKYTVSLFNELMRLL